MKFEKKNILNFEYEKGYAFLVKQVQFYPSDFLSVRLIIEITECSVGPSERVAGSGGDIDVDCGEVRVESGRR